MTDAEDGAEKSEIAQKEVVTATDRLLELRLVHSNPAAVSREGSDRISIKFDKSIWSDPDTDFEVNEGKPLIIKLPRQMDPGKAEAIASTMDAANGAANTVATGNIIVNILLGSSLKLLWGMINTLQFVVFFTDWEVIIPPNAIMAIETFRTIALGEFIPYEWLTEPLSKPFKRPEEEEGEDGENDRSNVLANMGVMLVILAMIVVLAVLIILLIKCFDLGQKIQDLFLKIKAKIFWNSILRFILQSNLKTAIGTFFALYLIKVSTDMDAVNAGLTLCILAFLFFIPIFFFIVLNRNQEHLETEQMKAKIGSLYLGIRTSTKVQRLYSSVFLARRLLYAILTVACIDHPNILIHVFLLTNLLYVVYFGWANPHDTAIGRRMEYFNEIGL